MKTLVKTFACSFAMAATFLACDNGIVDNGLPNTNCKQGGTVSSFAFKELEPSCNIEQKKLVSISDLHQEKIDWDYVYSVWPGYVSGSGEISSRYENGGIIVNGIKMSNEEYETYLNEQQKRRNEFPTGKRDLLIECVISEGFSTWIAMLTEEEVAKLDKTYGELYFEYLDSLPTSSNSNEDGANGSCEVPGGSGASSSSGNAISSSSSYMEFPQMDERVVAHLVRGRGELQLSSNLWIATDIDSLKKAFQVALNENNFDPECDYFAIIATQGSLRPYFVLSKDKNSSIIYNIHPSLEQPNGQWPGCMYQSMPTSNGFLICDKEGGLKDKIMLNPPPIVEYHDPTWDCWVGPDPDPYFEFRKP